MYEIANPNDPRLGEHQLRALKGGRYKTVFHGPPGTDVGDLHCDLEPYMEGDKPAVINHSGWSANAEQLEQLNAGAHVRLSVFQQPIPPLAVSVEPPVCECHGEAMTWAPNSKLYVCSAEVEEIMREGADALDRAELSAEEQVRRDFTPAPAEDDE